MRINNNLIFRKLSVKEVEELYNVNNFIVPPQYVENDLEDGELTLEIAEANVNIDSGFVGNKLVDESIILKNQPIKRIYLDEVKEKMKGSKVASFKVNGNHVSIVVDEETEIMVYNLEQRGTIFFRSESDTHFWERPILREKK